MAEMLNVYERDLSASRHQSAALMASSALDHDRLWLRQGSWWMRLWRGLLRRTQQRR
jgi:hypothetical protein